SISTTGRAISGRRRLATQGRQSGPWNLASYGLSTHGDDVMVDAQSLIFFHFNRLQKIEGCIRDISMILAWPTTRLRCAAPHLRAVHPGARRGYTACAVLAVRCVNPALQPPEARGKPMPDDPNGAVAELFEDRRGIGGKIESVT